MSRFETMLESGARPRHHNIDPDDPNAIACSPMVALHMMIAGVFAATVGPRLPKAVLTVEPNADPLADDGFADDAPSQPPPPATTPASSGQARPEFDGRGLLIGAYVTTGFSWASRIIATGIIAGSTCSDLDTCRNQVLTAAAFTYLAPISQTVATGLVVPGAFLKGRSDAWSYGHSGKPDRRGKSFVIAGAVLFGVFTATSIAIRPAYLFGCGGFGLNSGCATRGAAAGYFIGAQTSDTLSTVGAGLLSYGLSYSRMRKRQGGGSALRISPWTGGQAYGLSLSGRL